MVRLWLGFWVGPCGGLVVSLLLLSLDFDLLLYGYIAW